MTAISIPYKNKFSPEQLFMLSGIIVNGGNYLYNLVLGRILGPEKFADAAILITFLLVLSFVAMTFQLVTAKFSIIFEGSVFESFISNTYISAVIVGVILGTIVIYFSPQLQIFFKTNSSSMFTVFGIGVPFYFLMSVNRGVFQGKKELISLSITYQLEMISRLIITFGLLYFIKIEFSLLISIGIFGSFLFGLFPLKIKKFSFSSFVKLEASQTIMVRKFFIITAFYELTQIIINNSDIILVKHYFDAYEAGLYASLALIGRIVYFVAWMFVMLLLPTVVQLKKEGKSTLPILLKYIGYIFAIASVIVIGCAIFPNQIIEILFGDGYLEISSLLWKYALATGIFAISNIFAYYYLSLDKYVPVILSGVFGMLQIVLVVLFHTSLEQVVNLQIITMIILLIVQLIFFFSTNLKEIKNKYI
jgi:O-antigen/teichoic acid export membrane protein